MHLRRSNDRGSAGILEHEVQPVRGIRRVEREVAAPRSQDSEQGADQHWCPRQAHSHQVPRLNTQPEQMAGHGVGLPHELGVGQALVRTNDSGRGGQGGRAGGHLIGDRPPGQHDHPIPGSRAARPPAPGEGDVRAEDAAAGCQDPTVAAL